MTIIVFARRPTAPRWARPAARTGWPSCLLPIGASEIGIVSAGVVPTGTDFGQARRRLAALFAAISSEITARFTCTLAVAGANFEDTQRMGASSFGASSRAIPI